MWCLLERPSQPLNFNITIEDVTSLKLTWSEPVNTGGKIDYYIVSIYVPQMLPTCLLIYDRVCVNISYILIHVDILQWW